MKKNSSATPTKGELEILQALWRLGPSTVRAVHEHLGRSTGYTTILKLLQIMNDKGLVDRKEAERAHVYTARVSEKRATGEFLKELVARVFGGSPARLVLQALGSGKGTPSREELAEMRRLIQSLEEKQK